MLAITTTSIRAARSGGRPSPLLRLALTEAKLQVRELIWPIWGFALPIVLLIVFGSIPHMTGSEAALGGRPLLYLYVPVIIFMGTALICLIAASSALASYRERGILRRLAVTPAGASRLLAAEIIVSTAMVIVMTAVIEVIARLAYHVSLPAQFAGYFAVILLVTAALLGIGMLIASVAKTSRIAQGLGGLCFYPMMFFSGLWLPLPQMGPLLQHISEATPLGAASAAMSGILGGRNFPALMYIGILAAWAVGADLLAWR